MNSMIVGLFTDSKNAGEVVNELKVKGYTKDISVMAQDKKHDAPNLKPIKEDASDGATIGSGIGTVGGALASVFSGISSIVIPGIGVIVGGQLVALLGITGAAIGSMAGGIVGALVDLNIPEATAKLYKERIEKGQVLVAVSTDQTTSEDVETILRKYDVQELHITGR